LDWDADTGTLRKMRSKETEADYRYFREPDLLPVKLSADEIANIYKRFTEKKLKTEPGSFSLDFPYNRKMRFIEDYQLSTYDADILTSERSLADYFEEAVDSKSASPKTISNWIMNDLLRLMNDLGKSAAELRLRPVDLVEIIGLVESGKISQATGKALLRKVEESGQKPAEIVAAEGLGLIGDEDALRSQIAAVLSESPSEVAAFKAGKESLLGWFVGQVMRRTGGKADPKRTRELLLEMLKR